MDRGGGATRPFRDSSTPSSRSHIDCISGWDFGQVWFARRGSMCMVWILFGGRGVKYGGFRLVVAVGVVVAL